MAKIDLNAVLDGHDNPRVGDEYEVAPGKWGKMRSPTIDLQEKVMELAEKDEAHPMEVVRLVLDGDMDFNDKSAISGMPAKVVQDFFTLLMQTAERLTVASDQSSQ